MFSLSFSTKIHAIAEVLAFFIGYRYFVFLKKKNGDNISSQHRLLILLGAAIGAVVGSRLVGGLENIHQLILSQNKLIYFYKNKTVLGGFIGGIFGVEIMKKITNIKQNTGDALAYPIMLALIIGRIGCFCMGINEETYGNVTKCFTGLNLGDNQLRHPTTLYEIFFIICCWILLKQIEKKYQLSNGLLFKLWMIFYCIFRLMIDCIKPHYNNFFLTTIQITSLIGLSYYCIIFFINKSSFSFHKK